MHPKNYGIDFRAFRGGTRSRERALEIMAPNESAIKPPPLSPYPRRLRVKNPLNGDLPTPQNLPAPIQPRGQLGELLALALRSHSANDERRR